MQNKLKLNTLENLEKNIWTLSNVDEESYLIKTCNKLRKKQLINFIIEDLRIMISQNMGLKYLIPIAIEILNENILAEGDYYEGDLLSAVLSSDIKFWKEDKTNYKTFFELFQKNDSILKNCDSTWEIKKNWFELFKEFGEINSYSSNL